jgi:tRNA A37 threonylcarbamoyladenosine synthetase subunit TsaC/SUA5/YrdC
MDKEIFLTNTDTTIGFISKSKEALDIAKSRASNKEYITAISSFKALNRRVPKEFKNIVRRSKKTTFILNSKFSFRVVKNRRHLLLINRLNSAFTTSANKSNFAFNYDFALDKANVVIYPLDKLKSASKIYKLGKTRIKRIR